MGACVRNVPNWKPFANGNIISILVEILYNHNNNNNTFCGWIRVKSVARWDQLHKFYWNLLIISWMK